MARKTIIMNNCGNVTGYGHNAACEFLKTASKTRDIFYRLVGFCTKHNIIVFAIFFFGEQKAAKNMCNRSRSHLCTKIISRRLRPYPSGPRQEHGDKIVTTKSQPTFTSSRRRGASCCARQVWLFCISLRCCLGPDE